MSIILEVKTIHFIYYIGEVTQVFAAMGMKCLTVEETEEKISSVMSYLGISPYSPQTSETDKMLNTEQVLHQLSEAEKQLKKQWKSQQTTKITRRSRGIKLNWSKELNADQPVNN